MTTPPAAGATPTNPPPDAPIPRVASDIVRLGLACGAGLSSAIVTFLVVLLLRGGVVGSDVAVMCVFAFSAGWSFAYLVHTLHFFGRLDAPRLRAVILGSQPKTRAGELAAVVSGTGPTIAVQWSIIAIAAVLVFTLWPGLAAEPVTVVLSILVVTASWAVTIVAYALHYARADAADGDFQFPDSDRGRLFADYLYLAVQVQTTFSTSDVSLMSPTARRIVTGHTLVAFAFATVIIAMLISVLFLSQ
ncbi:MAG: DUF1345 domain-containing protein [Microbacterium sp.]